MKAKLPLIIVIVVVVILVVVAVILGNAKKTGEEGTSGELTDLKSVELAQEIYGFSADIKAIKDKTLTLEAWVPLADETAEPVKGLIKARVTDNTKIVKLTFPEEIPTDTAEPIYPEEINMTFEELKVGDSIDIGTVDNVSENIKNGTEFLLSHIFIIE